MNFEFEIHLVSFTSTLNFGFILSIRNYVYKLCTVAPLLATPVSHAAYASALTEP